MFFRREHLTPEQIKQHEEIQKKVETGNLGEDDFSKIDNSVDDEEDDDEDGDEERETVQSLPPPLPPNVTWEEYINAADGE